MRRCEDEKMWWQTSTIRRTLRSDALGKNTYIQSMIYWNTCVTIFLTQMIKYELFTGGRAVWLLGRAFKFSGASHESFLRWQRNANGRTCAVCVRRFSTATIDFSSAGSCWRDVCKSIGGCKGSINVSLNQSVANSDLLMVHSYNCSFSGHMPFEGPNFGDSKPPGWPIVSKDKIDVYAMALIMYYILTGEPGEFSSIGCCRTG